MSHKVVIIVGADDATAASAVDAIASVTANRSISVRAVAVEEAAAPDAIIEALLIEHGLNENERAMVWLDDQGRTRAQIAQHLGLTAGTVTNYWKLLYAKLGLADRQALQGWLKMLRGHIAGSAPAQPLATPPAGREVGQRLDGGR